jgi:hypothetical protein
MKRTKILILGFGDSYEYLRIDNAWGRVDKKNKN